ATVELVGEQHGEGIGLFARSASGAPGSDLSPRVLAQTGQQASAQQVPGLGVAVEARDVNGERIPQPLVLVRSSLQQREILAIGMNAAGPHANRDAATDALVFVCLQGEP